MSSSRVKIWKIKDAPKSLRSLYTGPKSPEWIALVPGKLRGKDLDDIIAANIGDANVFRHTRQNGDIVYIGMAETSGSPSSSFLLSLFSAGRI